MSESTNQPAAQLPTRDAANWAKPVDGLRVGDISPEATNLNVEGKQLSGPLAGFGQMWQKTYRIRLSGADVTPEQVIKLWKENFATFWPKGNRFFGGVGIEPGQVAVLNLAGPGGMNAPGGGPLISTGIMVIYADDESFSFMTPQGHMFAGMITFSAERETNPDSEAEQTALTTCAQVQALVRASDPLYEIGFRLGLLKEEDIFWKYTLTALADFFGVHGEEPDLKIVLVDPKVQWAQAKNVWHNSAVRTGLYTLAAPVRWLRSQAN
ncbi:MAG: hypothetical protein WBR35_09655 [Anaerolineae bacterium]